MPFLSAIQTNLWKVLKSDTVELLSQSNVVMVTKFIDFEDILVGLKNYPEETTWQSSSCWILFNGIV